MLPVVQRYVIIGNGVAGVTAALALRQRDSAARITLISGETDYFFSRTALMYSYLNHLDRRGLEPYERKVWKAQRIELKRAWVRDLDAGRRLLTLDSGETLEYGRLLLATGSVPNRIPWPGLPSVKAGVVNFVSMADLDACERLTPSTRQAVVAGGGLIGVELVECLQYHGVQTTFLVREPWYWPVALDQEEAVMIGDHIRKHGVDLRIEEEIVEVRAGAEGRVASVRTNRGNDLPCQMLGVTAGVRPAIDWLKTVATPPELGRGIIVNAAFQTSLPDVFAAGDCAEIRRDGAPPLIEQIWYSAKRQGELAARALLGDAVDYRPPIFFNSSKFFEIEFTTVGATNFAPPSAQHFYYRAPGHDISIRIVEEAGAVIGFNLLGSRWNHNVLERWIAERRPMTEVVARLHEAQFDVEFGRFDLSGLRQAFAARKVA
jgi:NAD(P)H-nitrite reductase large subunit